MAPTPYKPEILKEDWRVGYCPMFARKWLAETADTPRAVLIKELGLTPVTRDNQSASIVKARGSHDTLGHVAFFAPLLVG